MANCRTVYLDLDGQPSQVYNNVLREDGPEEALKAYLHAMFSSDLRFSAEVTPMEKLKAQDSEFTIEQKDEGRYTMKDGTTLFNRVTQYLKDLASYDEKYAETSSIMKALKLSRKKKSFEEQRDEIRERVALQVIANDQPKNMIREDREKIAMDVKNNKPEEFKRWLEYVDHMWDAARETGDRMHEFIEIGINEFLEVQRLNDAEIARAKAQGKTPPAKLSIQDVLYGNKSEWWKNTMDEFKGRHPDKDLLSSSDDLKTMIMLVMSEIEKVEKSWDLKPGSIIIRPEQKIYNREMNLAGTMDIMLVHPTDSRTHIIDVKTKNDSSIQSFDVAFKQRMGGVWSHLANNALNMAHAQISTYAAMAHKLGFNVTGGSVLVVQNYLHTIPEEQNKPPDQRKFTWRIQRKADADGKRTGPRLIFVRKVTPAAKKAFEDASGKNYNEEIEKTERRGFLGFMKLWGTDPQKEDSEAKDAFLDPYLDHREDYIKRRYNEIAYDKEQGLYYFESKDRDAFGKRIELTPEQYESKTIPHADFSREYDQIELSKQNLASNVVAYFNGDLATGTNIFGDRRNAIDRLLVGIDKETHELHVAADLNPVYFEDLGQDVLVAINKTTKEISVFSVTSATNKELKFGTNGRETRTNMWGRHLSDTDLEQRTRKEKGNKDSRKIEKEIIKRTPARSHDLYLTKLAVAALRYQKHIDGNVKVGALKVISVLSGDSAEMTTSTMRDEVRKLRVFQQYFPDDEFPKDVAAMLGKLPDDVTQMFSNGGVDELIQVLTDEAYLNSEFGQWSILYNSETGKYIVEQLQQEAPDNFFELIKKLSHMYNKLYDLAPGTRQQKSSDPNVKLIRNVIMQYEGIEQNKLGIYNGSLGQLRNFRAPASTIDYYSMKFEQMRDEYTQRAATEYIEFHREHLKLLNDAFGNNPSPDRFKNLYKDPNFQEDNEDQWMMLKDPKHPSLSKEEAAYIKFFNKNMKEALIMSQSKEKGRETVDKFYKAGFVPVVEAKNKTVFDASSPEAFMESAVEILTPRGRQYVSKEEHKKDQPHELYNRFSQEIQDGGQQFSDGRRRAMGINYDGKAVVNKKKIDMNLASILSATKLAGLETEYMGVLNTLGEVTLTHLHDMEFSRDIDTSYSRDFISKMLLMTVHNKFAEEGGVGRFADRFRRAVSTMLFSMNVQQMSTEVMTSMTQGTSSAISQGIMQVLKGNPWFGISDWLWAAQALYVVSPKLNEKIWVMAEENRILFMDLKEFGSNDYNKHKVGQFWKKALMFYGNTLPHKQAILHTFTSIAHYEGYDKAYVMDDKLGRVVYDETKDPRFYVYDPDLKGVKGQQPRPPLEGTQEYKDWQFWKRIRTDLTKENMIDTKTGRMKVPITGKQRKSIQTYATRLYGSMREDSRTLWDFFALARQTTTYKRWFFQKGMNYWTPTHESLYYGSYQWDPDKKEYYWQNDEMQGTIQSAVALAKGLWEYKGLNWEDLTRIQKENFSKFLADTLVYALMAMFAAMVWNSWASDIKSSPLGKAFMKGFTNAYSELNFMQTALGMNGSIFPAINVGINTLDYATQMLMALSTGNVDDAARYLKRGTGVWGALKTYQSVDYFFRPNAYDNTNYRPTSVVVNPLQDASGFSR